MRRTKAGSEPLPTQRNCAHAFNIHSYLSGVSILKTTKIIHLFRGSQRQTETLYSLFQIKHPFLTQKQAYSCRRRWHVRHWLNSPHTHKPLCPTSNQSHHDISHSHYDIITRGSQCRQPNPSRHRPASLRIKESQGQTTLIRLVEIVGFYEYSICCSKYHFPSSRNLWTVKILV